MTVKYTTTTKSGLTKTRTSKAHKEPIYTHALWVKGKPDERIQRYRDWICESIASERTIQTSAARFQKFGFEIEITSVSTEVK